MHGAVVASAVAATGRHVVPVTWLRRLANACKLTVSCAMDVLDYRKHLTVTTYLRAHQRCRSFYLDGKPTIAELLVLNGMIFYQVPAMGCAVCVYRVLFQRTRVTYLRRVGWSTAYMDAAVTADRRGALC